MKTLAFAGVLTSSLLVATALTPVAAADMTHERALNVYKEPHNWLLHHGNYEGWVFSQLKQINAGNVKNLKVAFMVALGGYESGGRYKHGNLQATPIVEDGMMYVTDGWGRSMPSTSPTPRRPSSSGSSTLPPIGRGPATWPAAASTTAAWRCGRTRSSRSRSMAGCSRSTRRPAKWCGSARSPTRHSPRRYPWRRWWSATWIVGVAGGEYGVRGSIDATDLNTGQQVWRTYTIPGPGEPGHETWKDGKERYKHGGGSSWRPPPTIRRPTPSTRASAMPAPTGIRNTGRATTNGRRACSRSIPPTARSMGLPVHPERPLRLR